MSGRCSLLLRQLKPVQDKVRTAIEILEDRIPDVPADKLEVFLKDLQEAERLDRAADNLRDAIAGHETSMTDQQFDQYSARIEAIERVIESMF